MIIVLIIGFSIVITGATGRDTPHAVGLRPIPVCRVQSGNWTGVIQESAWIPGLCVKQEMVADVVRPSASVVDVDLVAYVVAEAGKVRPAGRLFKADVIGDDCDRVRLVRTDKCVQVSVVSSLVLADQWSFSMAGSKARAQGSANDGRGKKCQQ